MYHVEASGQPYSSFRALCFKQGAPHSLSSRSFVAALRPRRLLTAQPQRAPYPDPDFPVGVPGSDQPDIRHRERLGEIFKSLSFPSQCDLIACQSWTTSSLFTLVHLGHRSGPWPDLDISSPASSFLRAGCGPDESTRLRFQNPSSFRQASVSKQLSPGVGRQRPRDGRPRGLCNSAASPQARLSPRHDGQPRPSRMGSFRCRVCDRGRPGPTCQAAPPRPNPEQIYRYWGPSLSSFTQDLILNHLVSLLPPKQSATWPRGNMELLALIAQTGPRLPSRDSCLPAPFSARLTFTPTTPAMDVTKQHGV